MDEARAKSEPQSDQQIEDAEPIPLPYAAAHRIIVVGGHESWVRAFRPLVLGDISYIARDNLSFDQGLIRGADMVVFQANAMPHTLYYRAKDFAAAANIPVQYFSFASAEKCARELARMDEEL